MPSPTPGANATVPGGSSVQVWWAPLCAARNLSLDVLTSGERDRWSRYRSTADQDRFALGVSVSRGVTAAMLGLRPRDVPLDRTCSSCGGDHGPPRLAAGGISLSVAHSGDVVAVAVTTIGHVGLDVERLDTTPGRFDAVAARVLAPEEKAQLAGASAQRRACCFMTYWTRKEAVLKASRDGLSLPMAELRVTDPGQAPAVVAWTSRPDLVGRLSLLDLADWPGHPGALALIDHPDPQVLVRRYGVD